MSDGRNFEIVEYPIWAIQYWSKRSGWWTVLTFVKPTRSECLREFEAMWTDRGDLVWRRWRDAGKARCVQVYLKSYEGPDA